jgi:hypothetical protein
MNSGQRCGFWGLQTKVTTNAAEWTLHFNDKSGETAAGSLQGPIRVSFSELFGSLTCTYEVPSISTSYSFEQGLGLNFAPTVLTFTSGSKALCPKTGELSLAKATLTVPTAAGNLATEVIVG